MSLDSEDDPLFWESQYPKLHRCYKLYCGKGIQWNIVTCLCFSLKPQNVDGVVFFVKVLYFWEFCLRVIFPPLYSECFLFNYYLVFLVLPCVYVCLSCFSVACFLFPVLFWRPCSVCYLSSLPVSVIVCTSHVFHLCSPAFPVCVYKPLCFPLSLSLRCHNVRRDPLCFLDALSPELPSSASPRVSLQCFPLCAFSCFFL